MEALIEKVWSNPVLHSSVSLLERQWMGEALGIETDKIDSTLACRLVEASAILACSVEPSQKLFAYKIATCAFDLFGSTNPNIPGAVRVVLSRLGNFPGMLTHQRVSDSLSETPWQLASEELSRRDANTVKVVDQRLTLTDFQKRLWTQLVAGKRLAIAAPTSAGKSFVLQAFLCTGVSTGRAFSACYLVPTRALISQMQDDISENLKQFKIAGVDVISVPLESDEVIPDRAIYVLTQERLQILNLNHPTLQFNFLVVDEAHSVQDGDRGVILQSVLDECLERSPNLQIIFASPSVSNLSIFGQMTGQDDLISQSTDDVTVSQNFINIERVNARKGDITAYIQSGTQRIEVGSVSVGQSIHGRRDALVHIANHFGVERQSIVYANGQDDAEKIAFQISNLRADTDVSRSIAQVDLSDLAKEAVHPKYLLATTVLNGVGFHYGNIPTILRRAVETAFNEGVLHYLVCTSTLLSGVNMPARNVFLCLPQKSRGKALGSVDFWNISGRAGRLKKDFQGNIFLIDYDGWENQPLSGPKASTITPAIRHIIDNHINNIDDVLRSRRSPAGDLISDKGLETLLVKLIADQKTGVLQATLEKASFRPADEPVRILSDALSYAANVVTLPAGVISASPTVSPLRQQRLFDAFSSKIERDGETGARNLLLKHPREADAFDSYVRALEYCHPTLIDRKGSDRQNRFFAVMLKKWMLGISISELVDGRVEYYPNESINKSIRGTLELVEKELRFNYVRILGCYAAVLSHAFDIYSLEKMKERMPSISLYLEVGASDKTMISFIAIGISRLAAKKLNDICPYKNMTVKEAKEWISAQDLEILGFSALVRRDIQISVRSAA